MKVISWTEKEATYELYQRLRLAKDFRIKLEPQWRENEEMLYNAIGFRDNVTGTEVVNYANNAEQGDGSDQDALDVGVNYIFRHWRFIHAQMSANPPTVQIAPTSSDTADKNAARAADDLVNYARKQYNMQERFDECAGKVLSKGTGWLKISWNPFIGEAARTETDENGDEHITMTGDVDVYSPSTWDVWVDPDAKCKDAIRYTFERTTLPLEEAISMFPEVEKELRSYSKTRDTNGGTSFWRARNRQSGTRDLIDIYEYTEKKLPINGMVGRHAYHLEDGTLLRPMQKNPHYNRMLPLHPLTDIDVEDQVYGKSFIEYEVPIQDTINRMDNAMYDNVKNHSAIRMFAPEGCELEDEAISDSPVEIIRGKGNVPPHFINPPSSLQDGVRLRDKLEAGGESTAGVNESMFGEVNRRMSGFSMQTAINAGNQVRRRLFNKYTNQVENVYKDFLGIVQKHWTIKKTIKVIGVGGAVRVVAYKGADIASGWDLTANYGASWSLDPASRREEIMEMMPHLKEAGWSMQKILGELRLNEVRDIHDRLQLAEDYQSEIFEEMIAKFNIGMPILEVPKKYQDHAGMLEYAYEYTMKPEFRQLPEDLQELIKEHIRLREEMSTAEAVNPQGGAGGGAGMAPVMGDMGMATGGLPAPAMGAGVPAPAPAPVPQPPQG